MALHLNICLHLLPAAILDFIPLFIKFFEFTKAPIYLQIWTPSNTCLFNIGPSSTLLTFTFLFKISFLLSFITNPELTAASINRVTAYSVARADHPIITSSACYILSRSVKNCSVRIGLHTPYHFLQYNTEQCCRQCIIRSHASFYAKCFCQFTLDFHCSIWILQCHF